MSKQVYSLVQDVYKLIETKQADAGVDIDKLIDDFGESMKKLMRSEFRRDPKPFDGRKIRMSNIGKPDRQLWLAKRDTPREKIMPHTLIKFLYGHMIEEMLLFLVRASGHEVTHEQHVAEVNGLRGSMDCKIDGVLMDVKSTSTYGFKKFRDATLAQDDPFGYVAQIKGYAHSEGETKYGWLAMDKQNGHLTVLLYDEEDTQAPVHEYINWHFPDRVEHVREMLKGEMPEPCHELKVEDNGNKILPSGCSYCQYKQTCYPGLRAFKYYNGPKFFAHVEKEPRANEIPLENL